MGIIWAVVIGFIVGVIAKLIYPGSQNLGFILTTALGILGSIIAGFIGQALGWYSVGQGAGFIGSIVGALIVLFAYTKLTGAGVAKKL